MSHASISLHLWDHIFQSVVFLINRLPSTTSPSTSPYSLLYNKSPDYLFLRVLGCLCYPLLRPYNSHKLQFRFLPCVFLGYSTTHKGYKCLHIDTNKVYMSRNVRFVENVFPFSPSLQVNSGVPSQHHSDDTISTFPLPVSAAISSPAAALPEIFNYAPNTTLGASSQPSPVLAADFSEPHSLPASPHAPPSPSVALQTVSALLPSIAPDSSSTAMSSHSMITRHQDNTRKPKQFPDHITYLTTKHPLSSLPNDLSEPTSFTQANKLPHWRDAMANELNALLQIILGFLLPLLLLIISLVVNGSIKSSEMQMVRLLVSKLVSLPKGIIKRPTLIMRKLLARL
jgi:hypothetical protein